MSGRQAVIVILVIVVLAAVGFGVWKYTNRIVVTTSQFSGQVTRIDDNVLYVTGTYVVESPPVGYAPGADREVQVLTDSDTQIIVTVYMRPTPEQIKINPGPYDLSELEQKQVRGRVSELLDKPVTITAAGNIFSKDRFTAQKIDTFSMANPGQ